MSDPFEARILNYLRSDKAQPLRPRPLAKALRVADDSEYPAFREALRTLMHQGRTILGTRGVVMLSSAQGGARDEIIGTYRHNRRGFGFVVPTDPEVHEDLFIPPGQNAGAITGDSVRAKVTNRGHRDGKVIINGEVTEVLQRTHKRFVGTLARTPKTWVVLPDGNVLTDPILTPDAGSRHVKAGTKVVVELTTYPDATHQAQGVITDVLGQAGEKDVDLKSVIVAFNLPGEFPEDAVDQARAAVEEFNETMRTGLGDRVDLSDEVICTIDPDDAKDYDDAISLRQMPDGQWQLGVHIADVSHFVSPGSPLDEEAHHRGNSCYFPGYVIPMLPEVLSNGVCSLQAGVPRLCKSAFITLSEQGKPVGVKVANTVIRSSARLRYTEAQAIIDNAPQIPHPDGPRTVDDYAPGVVQLLHDMNALARRMQQRRIAAGQLVLDLPEVSLVLDDSGKVVGAVPEDESFTHTIIEMFMVEANEAVARLLDSLSVPFIRRIHPEPERDSSDRLRRFVSAAGHRIPKDLDRKAIQSLLASVRGKPEAFAVNLAVLKSLSRAEYSPQSIGHYALASEYYCHFTSPIRRYADLAIHRLLDAYLAGRADAHRGGRTGRGRIDPNKVVPYDDLVELGRYLSFTERRADDAERELRQAKVLELLQERVGDEFTGVVTGITNFGIFIQIQDYLVDGLIRYEHLLDDWWDVDEKSGMVRGQRTGKKIGIGDIVRVAIVRVDTARRELDLSITQLLGKGGKFVPGTETAEAAPAAGETPVRPAKPLTPARPAGPAKPVGGRARKAAVQLDRRAGKRVANLTRSPHAGPRGSQGGHPRGRRRR
jgi:ribonuclease R